MKFLWVTGENRVVFVGLSALRRCITRLLICCATAACGAQTVALRLPSSVAYDSAGNMYVADAQRNQVLEVSLAGLTSVVAGAGEQGFAGDGSAAALAMLNAPAAVAVATDGTVYIADAGNQRVRTVSNGMIQTVAGTGIKGFAGDGGDARQAMLNAPAALALDSSGGLLIADSGNHRVRRLAVGVITTIAGTGVQGFSGDGGAAVAAEFDTPLGVAVASDGRMFVADSHNHRVRAIDAAGVVTTFAGTGSKGFSGDGNAAVKAQLFLPRGVAVTAAGEVIFADSDNHRLRAVDANGVITTVAGDGVQGRSADGAVAAAGSLDTPRGVALSSFGAATYSDTRIGLVNVVAADGDMYTAAPGVARSAVVSLAPSGVLTYGDGAVTVSVASSAPVAQGMVTLMEGNATLGTGALTDGVVRLPLGPLSASSHTLTAAYTGDVLHGSAVSVGTAVAVGTKTVTATAAAATIMYGGVVPMLLGTLSGVLPQDSANVDASFGASAPDLAPVGTYPITATLSGSASANYVVAMGAGSGSLQILQAGASVTVQTPPPAYAGLPFVLTAIVAPALRGVPTGSVNFFDGGTVVATGTLTGGIATGVYVSPAAGSHALTAAYVGDRNFLAATSTSTSVVVNAVPDFALTVQGSGTQTVQGGATASYTLLASPQGGAFSGSIVFTVAGLPAGAKTSFSPAAVVPGLSAVPVVLSIQTVAHAASGARQSPVGYAWLLTLPLLVWRLRRRGNVAAGAAVIIMGCSFLTGCGARTVATADASKTYAITVTGTSTNLAGATVSHTTGVSLTVE